MLRELRIKNLAIIDDVSINFDKGLNVLTGETGAGKSIIVDALCLALGERASSEMIRSNEKEAAVEAFFDMSPERLGQSTIRLLQDMGIDSGEGIIMKRVISAQGKSRAYINASMVNVQGLSDVSSALIDVHGQYEHQSLLVPDNQIDMLDAFVGLLPLRQELSDVHDSLTELRQQIVEIAEREKEKEQRIDILKYQISEIDAAGLKDGEEEELAAESVILGNSGRLAELANQAYESLYSSDKACITDLSEILGFLREISGIDSSAEDARKTAEEALPLLEETSYFLRDYKESDGIQERIELIKGLKRKYGDSIQAVLDFRERAVKELREFENSEEKRESLKVRLAEMKEALTEKAGFVSKKRKNAAKKIEQQVINTLSKLSMPHTKFSISLTREKGDDTSDGFKAGPKGIDKVEFLISPNVGEELKPLSKIASGGELSRIMLALKGTLARGDMIPVLIFDEIDAGIGGRAAEAVGKRLKGLSANHQTICITHLPQIASYADTHLKIEKNVKGKRTKVEIKKVEEEERAEEIARMLSGDGSEVSIKHAKEMLNKVKDQRPKNKELENERSL
jgi:DNA repair protein RecN (Recombination protein N)